MHRTVSIPLSIAVLSYISTFFLPSSLLPFTSKSTGLSPFHLDVLTNATSYPISPILISTSPYLLYIPSFVSGQEITNLLSAAEGKFAHSGTYGTDDDEAVTNANADEKKYRTSSSAVLSPKLNISQLVTTRALSFMSNLTSSPPSPHYPIAPFSSLPSTAHLPSESLSYYGLESPQLVSYISKPTPQYYNPHHDHFDSLLPDETITSIFSNSGRLYNRVASFFIYLSTSPDLSGGGTYFPSISLPTSPSPEIQNLLDTGAIVPGAPASSSNDHRDNGVTFMPSPGTGIFWINLHPSGLGDDRTLHAGLPVSGGRKVGMNLWVKRDFGWA